jgi:hypothetical protein
VKSWAIGGGGSSDNIARVFRRLSAVRGFGETRVTGEVTKGGKVRLEILSLGGARR